jgi:hypothetical protein
MCANAVRIGSFGIQMEEVLLSPFIRAVTFLRRYCARLSRTSTSRLRILSDNHDLILPDGRVAHLGSFRATAGIISDFFVGESSRDFGSGEDYLEFYLGTWAIKNRKLLKPVYQDIFSRLRACGVDWKYSFPRLFVVRFKRHEDQANENLENYDPSASFAAEQNEREEDKEFARTEDQLDQLYRDSVERARSEPPPQTVQAYFEVFGKWPLGWPPWSTL